MGGMVHRGVAGPLGTVAGEGSHGRVPCVSAALGAQSLKAKRRPGIPCSPLPCTCLSLPFSVLPPNLAAGPQPTPLPTCLPRVRINKQTNPASSRWRGGQGSRQLAFISLVSLIPTLIPAQHPVSGLVLKLTLLQAPSRQPFLRSASSRDF